MLVRAVLGPEKREDGELEVVRVPPQQLRDTGQLPIGQSEGTMERLFRDRRQVPDTNSGTRRAVRSFWQR